MNGVFILLFIINIVIIFSQMLDRLSDAMAFGALLPCSKCKGQIVFRSGIGYQCLGYSSEWAKCEDVLMKPNRVPFKVPKEMKETYSFLYVFFKYRSNRNKTMK